LVMSLVGLSCWACGIASWFFGRLVASFVTSSVFFLYLCLILVGDDAEIG
ncbi:hypothetical protein C2G38_2084879, partial [Gigaspora rosea]